MAPRAYEDAPIPIGFGQTASQPSLQAYYLSILRPTPDEKVLEIGTGCGFLTALLCLMADRVYSVERVRELSQRVPEGARPVRREERRAHGRRRHHRVEEVRALRRDRRVRRLAERAVKALADQLSDGGRMLIPVGSRDIQELVLVTKTGDEVTEEKVGGEVRFVPLLGRFAWTEEGEG